MTSVASLSLAGQGDISRVMVLAGHGDISRVMTLAGHGDISSVITLSGQGDISKVSTPLHHAPSPASPRSQSLSRVSATVSHSPGSTLGGAKNLPDRELTDCVLDISRGISGQRRMKTTEQISTFTFKHWPKNRLVFEISLNRNSRSWVSQPK